VILAEREIGSRKILRASPHFYNSEDEMVKTAGLIKALIRVLD
jgi:cysteine desulfurase/selenocysteine lyase